MRRVGAVFALVFFLATPILQWRCVIACADDDAPAATGHNHQPAAMSRLANPGGHECDQPSNPVATTAGARQVVRDWLLVSTAVATMTDRPVFASAPRTAGIEPPDRPPDRAAPLRI